MKGHKEKGKQNDDKKGTKGDEENRKTDERKGHQSGAEQKIRLTNLRQTASDKQFNHRQTQRSSQSDESFFGSQYPLSSLSSNSQNIEPDKPKTKEKRHFKHLDYLIDVYPKKQIQKKLKPVENKQIKMEEKARKLKLLQKDLIEEKQIAQAEISLYINRIYQRQAWLEMRQQKIGKLYKYRKELEKEAKQVPSNDFNESKGVQRIKQIQQKLLELQKQISQIQQQIKKLLSEIKSSKKQRRDWEVRFQVFEHKLREVRNRLSKGSQQYE